MKIRWPLVALGILFFTIGMCGRFLYVHLAAFSEATKKNPSVLSNRIDTPARHESDDFTYNLAIPTPVYSIDIEKRERPLAPVATKGTSPSSRSVPNPPKPNSKKSRPDLSAYKNLSRTAQKEDYLPGQGKTLSQIGQEVNKKEDRAQWEGNGLLGKLVGGVAKAVETVDNATLDTAKKAFGELAAPDQATIRPHSDGLKLKIRIPADSLHLKK